MEGPGADSEEKHEPVSDIDTAVVVVGLKALDPEWPIREAFDWPHRGGFVSAQAKLNNMQLIHQFPSRTMLERWISFLGAYVLAF